MRIAILGTGSVGAALARGLSRAGHAIVLGTRDPESDKTTALKATTGADAQVPGLAVQGAEVVIVALPWAAAEAAFRELGDLDGVTVIDCMNPLAMVNGKLGLVIGHDTSGGERVQAWLPKARVVKTLNQVGAEIMADAAALPARPVMFMASNHADAKARSATLLADLGFMALDAGDITKSRLLEPLAMVWINQALFQGKGRHWALGMVDAPRRWNE